MNELARQSENVANLIVKDSNLSQALFAHLCLHCSSSSLALLVNLSASDDPALPLLVWREWSREFLPKLLQSRDFPFKNLLYALLPNMAKVEEAHDELLGMILQLLSLGAESSHAHLLMALIDLTASKEETRALMASVNIPKAPLHLYLSLIRHHHISLCLETACFLKHFGQIQMSYWSLSNCYHPTASTQTSPL